MLRTPRPRSPTSRASARSRRRRARSPTLLRRPGARGARGGRRRRRDCRSARRSSSRAARTPSSAAGSTTIVVNAVLPQRFARAELAAVAARDGAAAAPVLAAVRSQHGLAAAQASQLRRLRREAVAPVSTLPFVAGARLDPDDVEHLAGHLAPAVDGASSGRRRGLRGARRASVDPEPVEQRVVAAPAAAHAHRELEVHARAELALELAPRGGADRLDHPPAGADEDALLRLGLDPHAARGPTVRSSRALLELLDDDLDGVRDLLEGAPQDLLADELGEQHVLGAGRERSSGGKKNGPSGMSVARCSRSASTPSPVRAEIGKMSSPTLELRRPPRSASTVRGRSRRSTLLTATTTGHAGARQRARR